MVFAKIMETVVTCLLVVMITVAFLAYLYLDFKKSRMEREWAAWSCPFPADGGYTEYDIGKLFQEYETAQEENRLLAKERYEGKKVILKGAVIWIGSNGDIDIKSIGGDGGKYVSCLTGKNEKVLDVVRRLIRNESAVCVRGQIAPGERLTIRIDDMIKYEVPNS
jgi:hypothetical protein